MASTATSQFHSHSNTLQQPLLPRPCSVHRVVPTSGPPGTLFMIFLSVAEPCPAHITLSIDGQPVEVTATYHPVLKNQWVLHAFVPSSPASKGAGGHAVVVLRLSDGGNYHLLDFRYELAAPAIPASTSCATIDPYHLLLSPLPPLPPHSPASLLPLPLPPSTYSSLPCYPPTPQRSCVFSIPLSSINSVSPKIGSISSGKRVKPSTHITAEDEQDPGANKFQRREWKRGYDIRTDIDYPSPGLDLQTPLFDMTNNWTAKELSAGRRLVRFSWDVKGTLIQASCAPVSQEEYHPNDLVISCIRRQEDERLPTEHLVTSCDVLYIAQRLLGVLFDTEEENRVRRNIQSIECATISNVRDLGTCESFPRSRNEKKNTSRTGIARSKNHDDSFFTRVMMYPNPKPRHIRKSFKVYRWEDLSKALGMIFNKYFCVKEDSPAPDNEMKGRVSQEMQEGGASSSDNIPILPCPNPLVVGLDGFLDLGTSHIGEMESISESREELKLETHQEDFQERSLPNSTYDLRTPSRSINSLSSPTYSSAHSSFTPGFSHQTVFKYYPLALMNCIQDA